jgi:hypothetical protein
MAGMAFGQYGAKSARIRALAIDIINRAGVQNKDYYGMIVAIHNWVRDSIRYVKDPIGQETLSYPEETVFNSRAGDCDDMTILEIALLAALGINAYPVVIGTVPGQFTHVYLHAKVPVGRHRASGQTIPLDPIMREWPAGREAPPERVKRKKLYTQYQNGVEGMSGEMMPGMGSYVTGPSYLDTEDSQAAILLSAGSAGGTKQVTASPGSTIRPGDKTLATTTSVKVGNGMGSDAMFSDGAQVRRPKPGEPGAFIASREDRYGRVWNNAPGIHPASNTGSLGPMTGRREQSMTENLTSERSRDIPTTAGILRAESRGIQRKIVVVGGKDRNKPSMKAVGQIAREVQGLGALVRHMATLHKSCRECSGMAGLGFAWDGAPAVSPAVTEVATLSWWSQFKADLLKAQAEVFLRYADKAEAKAVASVAKEAEKVAKEAKKVEAQVIQSPSDQQAAMEIKSKLDEQQKVNGLGFMFDGLAADEPTKVVGLWDNIRTWFADRKAWKASAPEGKRPAFSLWRKDHGLMYQGAARPDVAAATTPTKPVSGLPGMGGLTDTLKSPVVLVGLAAAAGLFLLRKKGK